MTLGIEKHETMPRHIRKMVERLLKCCAGHDSGDAASALLVAYKHALLQYASREDFEYSVGQAMMLFKMEADAKWGKQSSQ